MYRKNPLKWLPAQDCAQDEKKQTEKKPKKHK
nr:LOC496044 protein [Xenopus laevis]